MQCSLSVAVFISLSVCLCDWMFVPLVDEGRALIKVYETGKWDHINIKLLHYQIGSKFSMELKLKWRRMVVMGPTCSGSVFPQ